MTRRQDASISGVDQRGTRRTKVFLPAGVCATAEDTQARVHVLDISPLGARLHARDPAETGRQIDLVLGDARASGAVVWVSHPNFGLRFDEPLSAERLETIIEPPARRDPRGG